MNVYHLPPLHRYQSYTRPDGSLPSEKRKKNRKPIRESWYIRKSTCWFCRVFNGCMERWRNLCVLDRFIFSSYLAVRSYLFIHQSICSPFYLSCVLYLSIYLFVYPSTSVSIYVHPNGIGNTMLARDILQFWKSKRWKRVFLLRHRHLFEVGKITRWILHFWKMKVKSKHFVRDAVYVIEHRRFVQASFLFRSCSLERNTAYFLKLCMQ